MSSANEQAVLAFLKEMHFSKNLIFIKKRNEFSTLYKFNFLNTGRFTIFETNKAAASQIGETEDLNEEQCFQQDDAPPHIANVTIAWLCEKFWECLISHLAEMEWVSHLPDLKKDFFSECSSRTTSIRATLLPLIH